MSEPGVTEIVHEAYAFVCLRRGHGWEQAYEIRHHVDAGGNRYVTYVSEGSRVPSPPARLTRGSCEAHVARIVRAEHTRLFPTIVRMPDKTPAPPPLPEPLRVPVADSHTHLDMQEGTVADALAKAASVGVTTLIQVGCDLERSRWSARTAAEHASVWAAVALHPNEAPRLGEGLDAAIDEIDRLAALPQVRAVGETGLDYFRTGEEGTAAQAHSFRRHIDIAKRHRKALVIHDRDAHADVLRVLDEEGAPDTVVFHCYSGDAEMAKICADKGYHMSFAGNVTYKSAQNLRDAVAVAPPELLLVETDAPFLTPVPHRGRPNAPYLIPVTLRAMAAAKGMDEDDLAAAIGGNTARVFDYGT